MIETARLYLRLLTPDDLNQLYPIFSNMEVVKYLKTEEAVSREDTERALNSIIKHWERHGFGRWGVVFKETGKLIGYGGLRSLNGTPELVYLLDKPYWGMGLATEIAKACLKWGFERQCFERVVAVTRHEHAASRRVMEKVGMVYERDETLHDVEVVVYSISRATHQSQSAPEDFTFAFVAGRNSRQNPAKPII